MIKQLTLRVALRDDATFENFFPGKNNALCNALRHLILQPTGSFIYLWGNAGTGRSHLLQASCHLADAQMLSNFYLSLAATTCKPPILEGLENITLIAIDDIHAVAGNKEWEEALFHCYNRMLETGARLIISADAPPKLLPIKLPDLLSRLSSGVIFQTHELTDEEKLMALQLRAKLRGFNLPEEVARFLLNHYPRDMQLLFSVLDKLDQASLAHKRKVTIAFVKEIINPS